MIKGAKNSVNASKMFSQLSLYTLNLQIEKTLKILSETQPERTSEIQLIKEKERRYSMVAADVIQSFDWRSK